jgi:hypothetical protein
VGQSPWSGALPRVPGCVELPAAVPELRYRGMSEVSEGSTPTFPSKYATEVAWFLQLTLHPSITRGITTAMLPSCYGVWQGEKFQKPMRQAKEAWLPGSGREKITKARAEMRAQRAEAQQLRKEIQKAAKYDTQRDMMMLEGRISCSRSER